MNVISKIGARYTARPAIFFCVRLHTVPSFRLFQRCYNHFMKRILASVAVLVLLLGSAAYYFWNTSDQPVRVTPGGLSSGVLESAEDDSRAAIRKADIGLALKASAENKAVITTRDAQRTFDAAQLHYAFRLSTSTVEYLVSILDSSTPLAEPYKSIAAYSLLHTYYDTGDILFMIKAVSQSSFMSGTIVPRAQAFFPAVFEKDPTAFSIADRRAYFAAHLMALAERSDTIAAPATATTELLKLYREERDKAQKVVFLRLAQTYYRTALQRLDDRLYNSVEPVSAYDTVVGINHLAISTDYIRHNGFESNFPGVATYDIPVMLDLSLSIAREEVPSLVMFSTYLNAYFGAKYLPATASNDAHIDGLVRNIVGIPPFEQISQYSWATKRLINSKEAGYTDVFRRQNIRLIATRSETLRAFLTSKDGWTAKDFGISQ